QIIAREGLLVDGRAHPLLAVRRDALLAGARYWRQLRFSEDDPAHRRRPGRPKGEAWSPARAAAAKLRRGTDAKGSRSFPRHSPHGGAVRPRPRDRARRGRAGRGPDRGLRDQTLCGWPTGGPGRDAPPVV